MTSPQFITPDWPAPARVKAASTLRVGGVSQGAYASLNLGAHVDDDPEAVGKNRLLLRQALDLPDSSYITWLSQVHGTRVVAAAPPSRRMDPRPPQADASVADAPYEVCAVLTADCLPVLFCDRGGTRVAAAHAGWRGLVGGVLEETLRSFNDPSQTLAWLGPAIEQEAFEVGPEVRDQFIVRDPLNAGAFVSNPAGRWQADLYQLARNELARLGVRDVYGGGFKCFADSERFFSYRRDKITGRMATMIWLTRE